MNYDWPGNVRELTNLVERTLALTNSRMIKLADISKFIELGKSPFNNSAETAVLNLQEALQREERNCILKALIQHTIKFTLSENFSEALTIQYISNYSFPLGRCFSSPGIFIA